METITPPLLVKKEYLPVEEGIIEDEINLLEVAQKIWDGRWIISMVTLLSTAVAVFVALTSPLVYKAEVLMVPVAGGAQQGQLSQLSSQFGGLASLAGISLGGGQPNNVDAYLATLKSRKFIQRFAEQQGLLPILFAGQWDATKNSWRGEKPTTWQIYRTLNSSFNVSKDIKTGLVTISVASGDPEQAAEWANQLVHMLNAYIREETIAEAKRGLTYLQQQIQQTSLVGMQEVLYKLVEQQIQTITLAEVREQFAFSVIDPAVVPEQRESPKRRQMVTVGTVFGFLAGIVIVLIWSFLRQRFPEKMGSLSNFVKKDKVDWLRWLKNPRSRL